MRILIRNAQILDPAGGRNGRGDLCLSDGKILDVSDEISAPADRIIDATGLMALPGLVDMHVHLRDPGQTHKEDILTGCLAAASGGVTSLVCMPNTSPPADSPGTIAYILEKAGSAAARVYPAACITSGMEGRALCDLAALAGAGAAAFSDDGRPVPDAALMLEAMRQAASLRLPVLSHCEDLSLAGGGIMHEGAVSKQLSVKGIPAAAEDTASAREIALAASSGYPVHLCHVSTAVSLRMIRAAKRDGVPVTCETAPHYFTFTEGDLLSRKADFRMNPPLRTEADRKAVLEALADGTIDAIATDHAPHTAEEKAGFSTAPNGVIGLQTSLAAAYTALVRPGIVSMSRLAELMSVRPARIMGLPAGSLRPGENADLILFDPKAEWTVEKEKLAGKSHNTPFDGRRLFGRVMLTICRGLPVYEAL